MKWVLFAFVWLLCGCGPNPIFITPRIDKKVSYSLNQVDYARVGNIIVGVAQIYTLPTFVAREDAQDSYYYEYSTDDVWLGAYRLPHKGGHVIVKDIAASYGVHVRNSGYIEEGVIRLPGTKTDPVVLPESTPPFKRILAIPLAGSFQAALVYAGKRGSEIQLVYHEYLDGSKEPGMCQ